MSAFLLICVGLFATVSSTTPISKCDTNIENKIDDYQNLEGHPTCLIETASNNGIEFVVRTTYGYCPEDVTCIYTKTIPNQDYTHAAVEIYSVDKDKQTSQKTINVVEQSGSTYYPTSKVLRKHIWAGGKSYAVYVCSEDANAPEGPPTFFVKCASGHCDAVDVQKAVDVIECVGYKVPQVYLTCENECV